MIKFISMLNWKPNGVLSFRYNVEDINVRQARILSLLDRITEASNDIIKLAEAEEENVGLV